jgi:hypothetical protein
MDFEKSNVGPTGRLQAFILAKKRTVFIVLGGIFMLFLYTWNYPLPKPSTWKDSAREKISQIPFRFLSSDERQIANGTLGFSAIFALGLPDRGDKRDSLEMAAMVTDLKLTWIDGVKGTEMNPKAVPPNFRPDGAAGCWRGHMDIIRKIVKEGISSALIVEDDGDWDVNIVRQMQEFSRATKELLSAGPQLNENQTAIGSPYGENWDILWVGHCGGWPGSSLNKTSVIIHGDDTVPPAFDMDDQLWLPREWNLTNTCAAHEGRDPEGLVCDSPRLAADDRLVNEGAKSLCTASYAISLQGAKKYLARLGGMSLEDMIQPVDLEMGKMCAGYKDLEGETTRCLAPVPAYIHSHRPRGPVKGDSDIQDEKPGYRDVGHTRNVVWSAKLNALNVLTGSPLESQYVQMTNGTWRLREKKEYRQAVWRTAWQTEEARKKNETMEAERKAKEEGDAQMG